MLINIYKKIILTKYAFHVKIICSYYPNKIIFLEIKTLIKNKIFNSMTIMIYVCKNVQKYIVEMEKTY